MFYHLLHLTDFSWEYNTSVMRNVYDSGDDNVPTYRCLGFSPDAKFLATGQSDGDVKVIHPK